MFLTFIILIQIKINKPLAAYTCNMLIDNTKNIQLNETEDDKENNFEKNLVFKKYYEINNAIDYQHSACKITQLL